MKNQNKPKFGFIPFQTPTESKSVKKKPDLNQIISDQADNVAENYKKIYEAFIKKGFTSEQSFQLLLAVMNYKISVPL